MKKSALLLLFILITALTVTPATASPVVLKFAGQSPPDNMATKTMHLMAKEIEEGTKGRVQVKVFPANQLGNYSLVMQELIRGTVDMSMMSIRSEEHRVGKECRL